MSSLRLNKYETQCYSSPADLIHQNSQYSVLDARSQEDLAIRAEVTAVSTLELDSLPWSLVCTGRLACVGLPGNEALWAVAFTSPALTVFVQINGAARVPSIGNTIDGEVDATCTAVRGWERYAARFVVLAGGIESQVAELDGRAHESFDGQGKTGVA